MMKFREYDRLVPRTLVADSKEELDSMIEKVSEDWDFIDLQYSASETFFSALALLRKRETRCTM